MAYDRDEYGNPVILLNISQKCEKCGHKNYFFKYPHTYSGNENLCRCGHCGRWNTIKRINKLLRKKIKTCLVGALPIPALIALLTISLGDSPEALLAPGFWLIMLIIFLNNLFVLWLWTKKSFKRK